MAAEHQYFYEDEVYRINKKGNIEFGMVLENSELVSSDENSDAEDGGRMKKGHIRVAWHPTGVEEVIPERKVQLADRSLMPGDVVRRMIKGKDTQRGYCRDIKVIASVQVVGTKQVIPNVRSENLVPLEEFATDIAACLDSWVGGVKTVHSKLLIQCSDGSRCVINDIEASGLEDFNEKKYCDCEFPSHRDDFYPGQTLWGPLHCLEDAEWIHCTKELKAQRNKANRIIKVVVEEVRTDSVGVHWQCRAYSKDGAGAEKEQPKFLVQGEDLKRLKLLNVFEPCTLQVGDRNFYFFRAEDTVITKEQWRRYQHDLIASGNSITNGPAVALLPAKIGSPKIPKNKGHQNPSCKYQRASNKNRKLRDTAETSGKAGSEGVNKETSSQTANQVDDNIVPSAVPMVEITNGSPALYPEQNSAVDVLEEWDTEDTASVSDSMSISSGCSSVGSQGKKKRGPALMTKVLKKKKLRRTRKRAPTVPLTPGQKVVVETLSTSSVADVVWQDGSVEYGIPSTQLYPIHHLDDQEFFPGDFVIENKDESCMRVYGVVQSVDHAGRTATVKWFKTYTSLEEPRPAFLEENEVSVYDLKDHPDFQYRPGTVVIRVANFEGEDVNCTAGQVLDNYPEGMVRVWWVDGHISMSWPQDLYKVGEYDSEEGELWDDGSSDGSWETESEDCFIADDVFPEEDLEEMLKPKLAANIEKARIAMSRLEEIFTQNPSLQTTSVMRQLLDVYKDCRYLDKLMGTSFFHESHFQGLLERVRERGRANVAQRVADQVSRLFHQSDNEDTDKMEESCSNPLAEKRSDTEFCIKYPEMGVARKQEGLLPDTEMLKDGKELCSDIKADCIVEKESGVPIVIVKDAVTIPHAASNKDSSTNNSLYLHKENLVNLERDVVSITNKSPYYKSVPEVEENSREIVRESHSSITKPAIGNGLRSIGNCNTSKLHNQSDSGNNAKYNGCYNSPIVTNTGVGKVRHTAHAPVGTTSQGDDKGGTGHNLTNHNGCLNSISTSVSSRSKSSISSPGGTSCSSQGTKQTPDSEAQSQVSVVSNSHVCVRLCSLIKAQLVKAHGEVTRRFGGNQGLMTLSDAFNTHSPIDNGSHKDENEVEDDNTVTDLEIPLTKKEGSESLMAQDKAVDLSEKTSTALTEVPHITEKVKDGLRDMFHAISRFGQGAGNAIAPVASSVAQADSPKSAGLEEPKSNAEEEKTKPETVLKPTMDIDTCGEGFSIMDSAPNSHKFKLTMFQPTDPQLFFRTVRKEIKLLRSSLPPGIWVKGFEDRMDLYSVMIRGPEKTPYEDGLFFFDFQLSADYPKAPPLCHYISYCSDRLNPNLYEDGKVCVSLLGTWSGKGTEVWTLNSNLLQVIISIQGLILVSEPYFNEAGYEKQKGSQQGKENSRMYNEMAVLKLVQSLTKLILQPPPVFCEEIMEHFRQTSYKLLERLETWLEISERYNSAHPVTPTTPTSFREIHGEAISNALNAQLPEFPLIPASKGFCLTLRKTLVTFRSVLCSVGIREQPKS